MTCKVGQGSIFLLIDYESVFSHNWLVFFCLKFELKN